MIIISLEKMAFSRFNSTTYFYWAIQQKLSLIISKTHIKHISFDILQTILISYLLSTDKQNS